ncbi:MAG: polysaccharide deacetylase family protein [Acidobacteriota bacterium]
MHWISSRYKTKLRYIMKAAASYAAYGSGMIDQLVAQRTGIAGRGRVIILGYHRVVQDFAISSKLAIPSLLISVETLSKQLDLIRKKFECLSLDDALEVLSGRRTLLRDGVVLTFDDGYRDFYENAFPLLCSYGLAATIFVPTMLIGHDQPLIHDQLYYLVCEMARQGHSLTGLLCELDLKYLLPRVVDTLSRNVEGCFATMRILFELPSVEVSRLIDAMKAELNLSNAQFPIEFQLLNWSMLYEMAGTGITIGAHTCNHTLLTCEPLDKAAAEILDSKRQLEEALGLPADHFAYPDGRYDTAVAEIVRAAGFRSACTIEDRPNALGEDLYRLKRKLLWERTCLGILGGYSEIVAECQLRGLFANPAYRRQTRASVA